MARKKVVSRRTLANRTAKKAVKPKERRKRTKGVAAPTPGTEDREVIYAQGSVRECIGNEAITNEQARQLLDWQEETKNVKFGHEALLKDHHGKKIRCYNNVTNRPLSNSNVLALRQEILRKRWRFNGEPLIIGRTALILNGQHQLVALILACQEWAANPSQWEEFWPTEPTMEKIVVFGVHESDDVVNTMDTCKPRTLADVIYRSKYFADLASKDRNAVSRMTDYAVRFMWDRTGASSDAFAVRRTHSEALDFIDRHSKILECIKHIYEENGSTNTIGRFISVGYAAGLLYLMGCSTSNPETYREDSNESSLDWSLYDKASDFFVLLASGETELKAVSIVLTKMLSQNENVSVRERWSLLIKAWDFYSQDQPVKESNIELEYDVDKDGIKRLAEKPTIGGIDYGGDVDPTPDEIVERSAEVRSKKVKTKTKRKAKSKLLLGDTVWVATTKGKPFKADVVEVLGGNAKVKVATGYQGAGNVKAVLVSDLTPN